MKWQDLFEEHILSRGFEYYNSGEIEKISKQKNIIKSTITGNQSYHVSIDLNNISSMQCTCPHSQNGFYCKHMAAVLFALEYEDIVEETIDDLKKVDIDTLICSTPKEDMNIFLKDIISNDIHLMNRFIVMISKEGEILDKSSFQSEIDDIFNEYSQLKSIDFKEYYELSQNIEDYFKNIINPLLEKKDNRLSFSLLTYIFQKINYLYKFSHNENLVEIAVECIKKWKYIINISHISLKKQILHWIYRQSKNITEPFYTYFIDLLLDDFRDDEFVEDLKKMRFSIIHRYINENKYENAISLIKDSQKTYIHDKSLTKEYSLILLHIYKLLDNKGAYKGELWNMLIIYDNAEFKHYMLLKQQYSSHDWLEKRKLIILKNTSIDKKEIYYEEKQYHHLIELVINDPGLESLMKYENDLKLYYSQELLQKYKKEIIKASYTTKEEFDNLLKKIKQYKEGQKVIQDILKQIKM